MNYISALHAPLPRDPWPPKQAVKIHFGGFVLCCLEPVCPYRVNKSGSNYHRTMSSTQPRCHGAAIQLTCFYSLFFSMTGCRGKNSALCLYYSCFPEGAPLDAACTVSHSDTSPAGTARQTGRWAAPAPTHGGRRGWLLPTGKSKTPPPKTTRR